MVKTKTLVGNYIYQLSFVNEYVGLEDYVKNIFEGISKAKIENYCKDNCIYYKNNSNKEMLIQKIYGACNTLLSYTILMARSIENETRKEFYYRLYKEF